VEELTQEKSAGVPTRTGWGKKCGNESYYKGGDGEVSRFMGGGSDERQPRVTIQRSLKLLRCRLEGTRNDPRPKEREGRGGWGGKRGPICL